MSRNGRRTRTLHAVAAAGRRVFTLGGGPVGAIVFRGSYRVVLTATSVVRTHADADRFTFR